MLLHHPFAFIKSLFTYSYTTSGNLFTGNNSYWNDLQENIIIKLLAVCNVFTFKNYYADIIFFNFFFMFGPVALYRIIKSQVKTSKYILLVAVFLIPSFLFWCSGIHKDGFVFSMLMLCVYSFHQQLQQKKISSRHVLIFMFCFLLLFALRSFVALLLVPALVVWLAITLFPAKKWLIVFAAYICCNIAFITGHFQTYVAVKNAEFKALGGNSQLTLPALQPSFKSLLSYFPYGIDVAFFRPHINEVYNKAYLPAIAENIFFFMLLLVSLLLLIKNKRQNTINNFFIFCYCFALPNMLLAGYTITLTGAIVRYKSIFLPFLIVPLVIFIWQYIDKKFPAITNHHTQII